MNIFKAIDAVDNYFYDVPESVREAVHFIREYVEKHENVECFYCDECNEAFLNPGIHSSDRLLAACPKCGKIVYIENRV